MVFWFHKKRINRCSGTFHLPLSCYFSARWKDEFCESLPSTCLKLWWYMERHFRGEFFFSVFSRVELRENGSNRNSVFSFKWKRDCFEMHSVSTFGLTDESSLFLHMRVLIVTFRRGRRKWRITSRSHEVYYWRRSSNQALPMLYKTFVILWLPEEKSCVDGVGCGPCPSRSTMDKCSTFGESLLGSTMAKAFRSQSLVPGSQPSSATVDMHG